MFQAQRKILDLFARVDKITKGKVGEGRVHWPFVYAVKQIINEMILWLVK